MGGIKDGVVLADIITYLSKNKFVGRVTRKPRMKLHIIANLNLVLAHMKTDGIRLVNIGAPGR